VVIFLAMEAAGAGHAAGIVRKGMHVVLVGMPCGKRPLRRPRYRYGDNIKALPKERSWNDIDWVNLAPDTYQWGALVNTVMNLLVPSNVRSSLVAQRLVAIELVGWLIGWLVRLSDSYFVVSYIVN
jgi:hypothetical protein